MQSSWLQPHAEAVDTQEDFLSGFDVSHDAELDTDRQNIINMVRKVHMHPFWVRPVVTNFY